MPELYKRKPNTKCSICAKEIYRRPVQIEESGGKSYCSSECFGISCRVEKPCIIFERIPTKVGNNTLVVFKSHTNNRTK